MCAGDKGMKLSFMFALVGLAATGILSGCNVGMMPEGPSPSEVKAKIAAMPPDQQIAFYKNSPMPPAEKAAKIAEIEQKYNIKADAPSNPPGGPPTGK